MLERSPTWSLDPFLREKGQAGMSFELNFFRFTGRQTVKRHSIPNYRLLIFWTDTMYPIRYSLRSFVFLAVTSMATFAIYADGPATSPEKEAELIAVLQSEAPASEKAITCKNLAIYGSGKAVPELAKLLGNEQLSSWSRIALEAIPGSKRTRPFARPRNRSKGNFSSGHSIRLEFVVTRVLSNY